LVTTLDPSHTGSNFTLSGGNLTATGSGAGNATSRSTTSKASGKYYFEVTFVSGSSSTVMTLGIANSSLSQTLNALGLDANNSIGGNSNSNIFYNSSTIGSWKATANGDVCAVAVDFTNQLIWFQDITSQPGQWNGNNSFSPGGTGGAAFAATSGPYFAAISDNSNACQFVINFGNSAFTGSVPAGFTAWDGVAAPVLVYAPPRPGQTRWRPRKHFRRNPQFLPRHIYVVPFRLPQTPVASMDLKRLRWTDRHSRNRKFFARQFRPKHIIFPPKQPVKLIPQIIAQFQHRYARRKAHGFFPRQFRPRHIFGLPQSLNTPTPIGVYAPVPGLGIEKQRLAPPELVQERIVAPVLYQTRIAAAELYSEE
jgi:hypothetical protein